MRADISIDLQLDGPIPKFLAKALELSDFYTAVPYCVFYRWPPNSPGQRLARRYPATAVRAVAPRVASPCRGDPSMVG